MNALLRNERGGRPPSQPCGPRQGWRGRAYSERFFYAHVLSARAANRFLSSRESTFANVKVGWLYKYLPTNSNANGKYPNHLHKPCAASISPSIRSTPASTLSNSSGRKKPGQNCQPWNFSSYEGDSLYTKRARLANKITNVSVGCRPHSVQKYLDALREQDYSERSPSLHPAPCSLPSSDYGHSYHQFAETLAQSGFKYSIPQKYKKWSLHNSLIARN